MFERASNVEVDTLYSGVFRDDFIIRYAYMYSTTTCVLIMEPGCGSTVGSDAAWGASGTEIDPRIRHILLSRFYHEI